MTTTILIELLCKYPNKEVSFSPIRHSEYEIMFNESDDVILYNGKAVAYCICEESQWSSNITEIADTLWENKRKRLQPLQKQMKDIEEKRSHLEITKETIPVIKKFNNQIDQLQQQINCIQYESHPIVKSVVFAIVEYPEHILVLS